MTEYMLIVRHPLEASETGFIADRLAEALAMVEIEAPGIAGVVFADAFTLDRDPGRVFQLCDGINPSL